jgi:hypothetical protein
MDGPVKTTTKFFLSTVISAIILSSSAVHAALYDRGNGMIYDSTQNITWLQDASYAKTSGYITVGSLMTWDQSQAWANGLVYSGISGWRLPSANLMNPANPCFANDGTCDRGENNMRSEIGHLFAELGNIVEFSPTGIGPQPGYGFLHTAFVDAGTGQADSFLNVQNSLYWLSEQYAPDTNSAWAFDGSHGAQTWVGKGGYIYAWAVHDGDVAAIPIPATLWLFSSGLIGLTGLARQHKRATIANR